MKFFLVTIAACRNIKILLSFPTLLLFCCCATHHSQYGTDAKPYTPAGITLQKQLSHRVYLVGDAGYASQPHTQQLLALVKKGLAGEGKNATLLYLGDNIYPLGMPPENGKDRQDAEANITSQLSLSEDFKGKTIFIPGNHDWYHGLEGLKEQEKFVKEYLKEKKSFLPGKGCGINDVKLNDSITLITIDSEWFIEDWDRYPTINDDCDIKTRDAMFTEFESLLNKNQDKTILLAIHHPLISNGTHGGEFSLEKQLFPLKYKIPMPVLGSIINLARKTSGYSTQDIQSRIYTSLANRIKTLIQDKDNVIVVSGHDHNIQYIRKDNIHQIISGAGSKMEAARAIRPNDFSYGGTGYVTLDFYTDGTAKASYYALQDGRLVNLFETKPMLEKPVLPQKNYNGQFPATMQASVYTPEMTTKSKFHRFLFGEHYRRQYSTLITAPTVSLDTLHGGLAAGRAGGGHQSISLRLEAQDGREYVMRGLKKSATRFLQSVAFKNRYMGDTFKNTFAEDFLLDFYTTAHPYTPFVVAGMAESAGIYHTNPQLYYVPKQNALKDANADFGDALYMIEERPADEHKDVASFGKPDALVSTEDMLKNLHKDSKYSIDESAYIKARLFDMLIGDWDRHTDQWRWAEFKNNDGVLYRPVPKDRDQAFTKYDGKLLAILMSMPALRHMKTFKEDTNSIKWFNREPYPLDLALITRSGEKEWLEEAQKLQAAITDEVIDRSFKELPAEVQDNTADGIRETLKIRRSHLQEFASEYNAALLHTVLIVGTDKKEKFSIIRLPKGQTEVKMYTIAKDTMLKYTKTFSKDITKEIWIYGLDDDDLYEVAGNPDSPITLRLLGGLNHDTYKVENGRKVKIYDFKSKKNTYEKGSGTTLILTDDYEANSYDMDKPKYNYMSGYPYGGYNPDDGIKLGAVVNYTVNNFNRRPYSQKHNLKANYFFATDGFELAYNGRFMNVASKWNFALDALYTSPNFSINYFGLGNETVNDDDDAGLDFNRVKLQVFRVSPSFFYETRNGSFTEIKAVFETLEIDGTTGRFVNMPGIAAPYLFEHRLFGGINAKYAFENFDNKSLPAIGMSFYLAAGWKTSLDILERNFPHAEAAIAFTHNITADEKLVAATIFKGKALFNNNFEFYQAATLGGDNDLRGFRRERFAGKQAFYQSTDLRLTLGSWKSSIIPVTYGMLGGYDYGRVWLDGENSDKWHQSVGGGLWLNGIDLLTARLSCFYGSDGARISFGLGFGF